MSWTGTSNPIGAQAPPGGGLPLVAGRLGLAAIALPAAAFVGRRRRAG